MAEKLFTVYKTSTGEIQFSGRADNPSVAFAGPGLTVVEGVQVEDPTSKYWNGSAFVDRPDLDTLNKFTNQLGWVADGVDVISYGSALPNPTKVTISCSNPFFTAVDPVLITDGTLQMVCDVTGIYSIVFEAFPYKKKTITVEAFSKQ